jgi:hypothetical protein
MRGMDSREQALAFALGDSTNVGSIAPTLKTIVGTDRAANTEVSETVPTGKLWKLLAVSVQLAQGATQTPLPHLRIKDANGNVLARIPGASSAMAVSTTCRFTWAPGQPLIAPVGATTEVAATAPLPSGLLLRANAIIETLTAGIGANSDYGVPSLLVVEYA